MNRKKFLKEASALMAAGIFSAPFFESCSTDAKSVDAGPRPDSLQVVKNLPAADSLIMSDPDSNLLDISRLILDGQRVLHKDTINSRYTAPIIDNYTRRRYCDIVGQNAERILPRSKPYIEKILESNSKYRTIFDIPPEYNIALFNQESDFDPDAVSSVGAIGIAQLMIYTAKGLGMDVYDARKYPELYSQEKELRRLSDRLNILWNNEIMSALKGNRFDIIEKLKKEHDETLADISELKAKVRNRYINQVSADDDERLDPYASIDVSARLLAELARASQEFFGGRPAHNIPRGIAAYNCGFGNVKKWKGLPIIPETVGYQRNILVMADKLMPSASMQESVDLAYDTNPQIISELITNKIYSMRDGT